MGENSARLTAYRPLDAATDRAGLVVGDRVVDLVAALGHRLDADRPGVAEWLREPGRLELFLALDGWEELVADARGADGEGHALAEVTLRPPVRRPEKIIGVGLNYLSHADEAERAAPDSRSCSPSSPTR